jgi:hypothetical protein
MSCYAIVIGIVVGVCVASLAEMVVDGWRKPVEIVHKDDWDGGYA